MDRISAWICMPVIFSCVRSHRYDFKHNFDRWGVLGSTIWANPVEFVHLRTWESHADYLYGWLTASLDHVCSVYCG